MPVAQLRPEFSQALAEAGYQAQKDLLALVQDGKQDLARERNQGSVELVS